MQVDILTDNTTVNAVAVEQSSRPADFITFLNTVAVDTVAVEQSEVQADILTDVNAVNAESLKHFSLSVNSAPLITDHTYNLSSEQTISSFESLFSDANSLMQSDMPDWPDVASAQVDPEWLASCKYYVTLQVKRSDGSVCDDVLTLYHNFPDVTDALNYFISVQADVEELTIKEAGNNEFYANADSATSQSDDISDAPSYGQRSKKRVIRPENGIGIRY